MSPTRVSGSRNASGASSTTQMGGSEFQGKNLGEGNKGEGVEPEVLRRKVKHVTKDGAAGARS